MLFFSNINHKKSWILNTLSNGVRLAREKSIKYHAEQNYGS